MQINKQQNENRKDRKKESERASERDREKREAEIHRKQRSAEHSKGERKQHTERKREKAEGDEKKGKRNEKSGKPSFILTVERIIYATSTSLYDFLLVHTSKNCMSLMKESPVPARPFVVAGERPSGRSQNTEHIPEDLVEPAFDSGDIASTGTPLFGTSPN